MLGTSLLWRSTTMVFTFLKVKSAKCLCLFPVVLVLLFWSWSCKQRNWSCYFGLGLKNLILFTSLTPRTYGRPQGLKWFCEATGAHLTKPGWSKPHTHSNLTNFTTHHQTCKIKTDFFVSDRSCAKTDGLRPHRWIVHVPGGYCVC